MDIQKEEFIKRFKSTFVYDLLSQTLTDEQLFEHVNDTNGDIIWFKDQTRQMWFMWQAAQQMAVPESRTDFEIIDQTLKLVDLLASSMNVYQRDPNSKVYPFESKNPRVNEWWCTACKIQDLLTQTDPENCDFEEYKAMIEAQERSHD
ncbi:MULTISPECIES: hypothetical protein [unclassified Acinetobacter]|uniref:hypothetical protein n=1 Tax=unclassified Acinetobacter TaxID=196816 RepID=UPI001023F164|nr:MULTISPECIES: hypothetical protein [unclassified Acinetobacter]RZG71844.1 hypothetical protein EXE09_17990 [Acinetobacter sp. WCHAc060025]RZG76835.1 hypothetical protein EXE10_19665 [Acinetobacter sp. WCHAc060033]